MNPYTYRPEYNREKRHCKWEIVITFVTGLILGAIAGSAVTTSQQHNTTTNKNTTVITKHQAVAKPPITCKVIDWRGGQDRPYTALLCSDGSIKMIRP